MCGIVGAVDRAGARTFDWLRLSAMAVAVAHRGPDDAAGWVAPGVAMACQRLAIQDPTQGRQPLADPGGRVRVAFNGELFNAVSLRADLLRSGHVFRTRCDTELWPALYLEHGSGALERAQGQFAVALWDAEARSLLLARDRIGICPLYVAEADGWLLFASEIKGLLASGLVPAEADPAGIDHVFSLFAAGTQRTCFRGVQSLWPGHALQVHAGAVTRRRYWDLDFPRRGEERRGEPEALRDELDARLTRAVASRLRADVPVASYLSGGVDSTLLLAVATAEGRRPVDAFTIGFGTGGDERPAAATAARALDARAHTLVLDGADIAGAMPAAVLAAEGPIMDTANACLARLAEAVRARGFKVVLTGEGADEALGGYVWHKARAALAALDRRRPGLASRLTDAVAGIALPGTAPPRWRDAFGPMRPAMLELYEPLARARALFYGDGLAAQLEGHDPFAALDLDIERMQGWHPLNQSLYLEYRLMLPGHLLLGKGDRVAMRSGVEPRFPFLDEELVAFAASLAPDLKLRGWREKWLLREVGRRRLPRALRSQPKTMFKAGALCTLSPQPLWVDQLVSPDSLRATGYFDRAKVAHERRLQERLPAWSPHRFVADAAYTAVVTTQLWHHLFFGGGLCELPPWSPPPPARLARL